MTRTIELGAPSVTGKDTAALLLETFAEAKFPLKVLVKNLMPRDVVFPEVAGLLLSHVASATGTEREVVINDFDLMQRLVSSIEQVAELNGYESAITIAEVLEVEVEPSKKPSDGLSFEQLKDALKQRGVDFASNPKKSDLAALLDAAAAGASGASQSVAGSSTATPNS
jgi:hypothetical protein